MYKIVNKAKSLLGINSSTTSPNEKLVQRYENKERRGEKGFVVDYFGSKIDTKYVTHLKEGVLGFPNPDDGYLHEFIEYLGTIVAIDMAEQSSFTVMELGAGFGPWLVRGVLLAKAKGIKKIKAVGLEADKQHYDWMGEHLKNNGIVSGTDEITVDLYNTAISADSDFLYFPDLSGQQDWGAAASNELKTRDYRNHEIKSLKVNATRINDLLVKYERIDLLHIDIQGSEFEVLKKGIDYLNKNASVLVVGTHSRKIEGDLIELFYENKWILRDEKPCQFTYNYNVSSLEGMTTMDGNQVWINSKLSKAGK